MDFLQCYSVVTDRNTVHLHCLILIAFFEFPDYAQINDELYTFSQTFLVKEPIYNLMILEIYTGFPMHMCAIFITAVANYLPNTGLLSSEILSLNRFF